MIKNNQSVKQYLNSLDEQTAEDSEVLLKMMQRISNCEPRIENAGTISFDTYHYKYNSGREGDSLILGFYPRKGKTTIYMMDGTVRYSELLEKLGKHTTTGYCIYIKKLDDIDLKILEQILKKSFDYIKSESSKGSIDRILWQDKI